jgi:hypothetical protein
MFMRVRLLVALALVLGVGHGFVQGLGQGLVWAAEPNELKYIVQLFFQEGDPRGRSELLSRPQVLVMSGQQGTVTAGQPVSLDQEKVDVGLVGNLVVTTLPGGKVKLKMTAEMGTLEQSDEKDVRVRVDRAHFVREVELGDQVRLMVCTTGNKKKWVDVVIRERK